MRNASWAHWGTAGLWCAVILAGALFSGCGGAQPVDEPQAFSVDQCARKAFNYFRQEADPVTGLVKDRATNVGPIREYDVASIAATGFGLVAICIGAERGWLTRDAAYGRALNTLRFLSGDPTYPRQMPQEHGFFYHFVNWRTGQRVWDCEVSSVDTAWLLGGVLFAGEYFQGTQVEELAGRIYRRVDFAWMLNGGNTLCHGWKPEGGFLPWRWGAYSEHMLLYLLAIGSPTHAIPSSCWSAWSREQGEYAHRRTFVDLPLFCHQFSHCFVDFRNRRDSLGFNYWQTSVNATIINSRFCRDQAGTHQSYRGGVWGLSVCDGPTGYHAYRAPPNAADHDGTVAPWAVCASIVFDDAIARTGYDPALCRDTLGTIYRKHAAQIWGRYGFSDAFNVDLNWYDTDVIGIDLGAGLLMVENQRDEFVWRRFRELGCVKRAMRACGFG